MSGDPRFEPLFAIPDSVQIQRIVSLVPSITESLFDLDLGDRLVGITDYCVHPAGKVEELPRLGGPKNPHIEELLSLNPDLVIANQEENTPEAVAAISEAGVRVWLTFPQTVPEALEVLWALARLNPEEEPVMRLRLIEDTLEWIERAAGLQPPRRFFCPIWQENTAQGVPWWMTFNQYTYAHDLLIRLGGENIFAERERRYPLEADLGGEIPRFPGIRDTRYPRVTLEEISRGEPEIILLPSEPFPFDESHREALMVDLSDCPAVRTGQVYLVDGSLITWHGTRLGRALRELPRYFSPEGEEP